MFVQGLPDITDEFAGVSLAGRHVRVAASVTLMRYGAEQAPLVFGEGVMLHEFVRLVLGGRDACPEAGLILGDRSIVNVGAYLSGEGGLVLGEDVLIGPHARLLSAGHAIHGGQAAINANPLTFGRIEVGDGAWIGAGATVLQGVRIGRGAVVGAGAVVTRDVPDFAVVVGVPGRVVHYRRGFEPAALPSRPRWRAWLAKWLSR